MFRRNRRDAPYDIELEDREIEEGELILPPRAATRPSDPLTASDVVGDEPVSARSHRQSNHEAPVAPLIVGEASKFGMSDWWDVSKNWHQLAECGPNSDVRCEVGTVGDLAVIGASLRGRKHHVPGTQNEDAFHLGHATSTEGRKFLVAVLCDGLSSASLSGFAARKFSYFVGSDIAAGIRGVSAVTDRWFREAISDTLARAAKSREMFVDSEYVTRPVEYTDVNARDYLVTLTVVVVEANLQSSRTRAMVACSIGDSPILSLSPSGEWVRRTADEAAAIVETRTAAFPLSRNPVFLDGEIGIDETIVIATDGVANFLIDKDRELALGKVLGSRWRTPMSPATFINDLSFDLRSADDDRTAIVVWSATNVD